MAKAKIRKVEVVDINSLNGTNVHFEVKIDNKPIELQIGDKLHFPENCPYLKTVMQISIFEDKSINYLLKWYDGIAFQTEIVSVNDLKLLNLAVIPRPEISLDKNDSEKSSN